MRRRDFCSTYIRNNVSNADDANRRFFYFNRPIYLFNVYFVCNSCVTQLLMANYFDGWTHYFAIISTVSVDKSLYKSMIMKHTCTCTCQYINSIYPLVNNFDLNNLQNIHIIFCWNQSSQCYLYLCNVNSNSLTRP